MRVRSFITALALALALALTLFAPGAGMAQDLYDVVILGGRVMDPETGRDEITNMGIRGERIEIITTEPIRGRETIDAGGRIVAPGFIDILANIGLNRDAHVIVNGTLVLDDGEIVEGVVPGQWLRHPRRIF